MSHSLPWMFGEFDPVQIETDFLKSKLIQARRSGDRVTEALVISNLRNLGYKATG